MKVIFSLVILFCSLTSFAQTKEQARQTVWELLERNNPDGFYFMDLLYKLPTKFKSGNVTITSSAPADFMMYVQRYKRIDILSDISTTVHEACHMYQSQKPNVLLTERGIPLDFDSNYSVYYICKTQEHLVKHTPTFPSIKMANEITGKLQSFRYETYIKTNQSIMGTQQSGVYGLMDEWSAYYNGFKTTVLNFSEYEKESKNSIEPYYNFLSDAGSIRVAYPEFKFYIVHYLEYASRKEKEIFNQIMKNDDFRAAFRAIDLAFNEVINQYTIRLEDIKMKAESMGLTYEASGEYIMIGNRGVGSFNDVYTNFETTLASPKYAEILNALNR